MGVLGGGVEAGTVLADSWEVAVADELGVGVVELQTAQEGEQRSLLGFGTGVVVTALAGDSAFVADADGVLVVMTGVGSDKVLVAGLVELAVAGDVVVVACEPEACLMAGDELGDGEGTVFARRTAVNDDKVDGSHKKEI